MLSEYIILVAITLIGLASSQDANCNYSQNVTLGVTYTIRSPNYPNSYGAGIKCRWIARCPSGYNCKLDCPDINLPQTLSCTGDQLLISKSGDPSLTGADKYCGVGTLSATSVQRDLSIGLITAAGTRGGRFSCTISAVAASTPNSCSCGYKKTNRIVGGQETQVNEYPMMAGLIDSRTGELFCGGVIIYSHYIMTAAHCVANMAINNIMVVVGEHNVNSGSETTATQTLLVADVLYHNLYNENTYDYDIALILTSIDIVFSASVGQVCLPFNFGSNTFAGQKITALGWGTYFSGSPTSPTLQKVDLDVISQESCRNSYPTLTSRQMCTYTPGKDTCQYDSGGPNLYLDPATGLLFSVGIISSGQYCGTNVPGMNTRVTELMNWIVSNTPDANYCKK